jgi:hypothetical protein
LLIRWYESVLNGKFFVAVVVETYNKEGTWVDNNRLYFDYDKMGDILYISKVKSYSDQESDEIEDGIICIWRSKTESPGTVKVRVFA